MAEIRKVWTGYYKGTHFMAPKMIQVPSIHTSGRPVFSEIREALKKMGYSDSQANEITGSNLDWDFK